MHFYVYNKTILIICSWKLLELVAARLELVTVRLELVAARLEFVMARLELTATSKFSFVRTFDIESTRCNENESRCNEQARIVINNV